MRKVLFSLLLFSLSAKAGRRCDKIVHPVPPPLAERLEHVGPVALSGLHAVSLDGRNTVVAKGRKIFVEKIAENKRIYFASPLPVEGLGFSQNYKFLVTVHAARDFPDQQPELLSFWDLDRLEGNPFYQVSVEQAEEIFSIREGEGDALYTLRPRTPINPRRLEPLRWTK